MASQELENLIYEQIEEAGLGRSGLITWRAAHANIVNFGRSMLLNYENEFGKLGNRGAWKAMLKARKVVGLNVAKALVRLRLKLYTNTRKRRGIRRVSTRNWPLGATTGKRHGRHAYRRPRGRQPLTVRTWVGRYHERLVKRRKYKNKADRPRIKVPKTKNARPRPKDPGWIRVVRFFRRKPGRLPLSRAEWLKRYRARLQKRYRKLRKGSGKKPTGVVVPKTKWKRPGPGRPNGSEAEAERHPIPMEKRRWKFKDMGEVIDYGNELIQEMKDYALEKAEDAAKQKVEELADAFVDWIKKEVAELVPDGR